MVGKVEPCGSRVEGGWWGRVDWVMESEKEEEGRVNNGDDGSRVEGEEGRVKKGGWSLVGRG